MLWLEPLMEFALFLLCKGECWGFQARKHRIEGDREVRGI